MFLETYKLSVSINDNTRISEMIILTRPLEVFIFACSERTQHVYSKSWNNTHADFRRVRNIAKRD